MNEKIIECIYKGTISQYYCFQCKYKEQCHEINKFFKRKCRFCGGIMEMEGEFRYGKHPYWKCKKCNYEESMIKYD